MDEDPEPETLGDILRKRLKDISRMRLETETRIQKLRVEKAILDATHENLADEIAAQLADAYQKIQSGLPY